MTDRAFFESLNDLPTLEERRTHPPTLYAVFKQGVYRHECGGIFADQLAARTAADQLAADDRDDYHTWQVVPFTLGAVTPGGANTPQEAAPVYQVRQGYGEPWRAGDVVFVPRSARSEEEFGDG